MKEILYFYYFIVIFFSASLKYSNFGYPNTINIYLQ
jgi:hypothetical protein